MSKEYGGVFKEDENDKSRCFCQAYKKSIDIGHRAEHSKSKKHEKFFMDWKLGNISQ